MSAVRLGDHAKLIRGITFKPADKCDPDDEGAVVCMRTKNVQSTLDESDLIAVPRSLVKNPETMLAAGDILVSSANSWNLVGKCCQVRELAYPSTAGGFISILRPKTGELDPGYLYRWFSSDEVQKQARSFGNQTTNISNLNHKRTLTLQIPLPPLPEQKRIAGILDAADALRAKRRESLAQLDSLLQSTFLDMFGDPVTNPMGWDEVAVADFCDSSDDVRFGPFGTQLHQHEFTETGVPLWGIKHVNSGFSFPTDEFVTAEKAEKLKVYSIIHGDLVMTRKGTIGNCHIYPNVWEPGIMHSDLLRLRVSPTKADAQFVCSQFVYSRKIQRQLELMSPGAVMPGINVTKLKKLMVESPPLDLQRRFAAIVESVEKQKTRVRAYQTELDAMFASIQSRAFNGEL